MDERTTKCIRIVSNTKKTYKKTTSMRQVVSLLPFNCIKEESCCWFHRRWYDESKQTLIVGRGVIHHQYSPESCLLDFGRSSYCYKKSEPWSCKQKAFDYHDCYSCCFRLNLCLASPTKDDGCGYLRSPNRERKNLWLPKNPKKPMSNVNYWAW